jgi:hypothetical protein
MIQSGGDRMAHIGFKLVTITAAWFALCSAAFAADTAASSTQASAQASDAPITAAYSSGVPSGAVATSTDDATARQIDAFLADDGAPGGAQAGPQDQAQPRAIHGEAGVSIGSRGYRNAYVAADIPVGQNSDLGVAVSDTKIPSYHGYGGGESKSLAVSLNINTANGGGQGCGAPHWGQALPTDHFAPACAQGLNGGEAAGLAPGLAAMEAASANR